MSTETPDTRHFRLALGSFIGKDRPHNQTTLAEASGVPRSLINEILRQKRFAGRVAQEKLARACGYSLADFLAIGQSLDQSPEPAAPPSGEDQNADSLEARHFYLGLREYIQRDRFKTKNKDDLARLSGVDRKTINAIYSCRKDADQPTMLAIAAAIDIPLADLLASGRRREEKNARDLQGLARPVGVGPTADQLASAASPPERETPSALPVYGLASCARAGWKRRLPVPLSASLPKFGPRSFVVIADGFSMLPAGIGTGMFCYCDPDVIPIKGDAVYLYNALENESTIKEFIGWGPPAGARAGFLKVRGWHDPDQWKRQKEFFWKSPRTRSRKLPPSSASCAGCKHLTEIKKTTSTTILTRQDKDYRLLAVIFRCPIIMGRIGNSVKSGSDPIAVSP